MKLNKGFRRHKNWKTWDGIKKGTIEVTDQYIRNQRGKKKYEDCFYIPRDKVKIQDASHLAFDRVGRMVTLELPYGDQLVKFFLRHDHIIDYVLWYRAFYFIKTRKPRNADSKNAEKAFRQAYGKGQKKMAVPQTKDLQSLLKGGFEINAKKMEKNQSEIQQVLTEAQAKLKALMSDIKDSPTDP